MGNKTSGDIDRNSFDFLAVIGKGGFGKVWSVRYKKNSKEFALKEMSKARVIEKKCVSSVLGERDILAEIHHPFIINMIFSFQDSDNLYLVMNLFTGGDLRYHIGKGHCFSENESKFFIGCLILGLEVIHANNIIHRDIKPENLVLDDKGYLKVTDFGIAKKQTKQNANETSGTPGYMAPEVMCFQNHTVVVDYYAMGIICYELMMGIRPYVGESRNVIKEKILSKQIVIKKNKNFLKLVLYSSLWIIFSNFSLVALFIISSLVQKLLSKLSSSEGIKGDSIFILYKSFQEKSLNQI